MSTNKYKATVAKLLSEAGIEINGPNRSDIQVHNEHLYQSVLSKGSLGLGESYMDGWWDSEAVDELTFNILRAHLENKVLTWDIIYNSVKARLLNFQTRARASEVAIRHYDIGNKLYSLMLDKSMTYTCGYWKEAKNLEEAQIAKLNLVCKKLGLKPGMKVLDIGCGYGSFMKFAAENYGVSVVGISLSKEQTKLGQELCKGLAVEFKLQDYRELSGEFDRIVSIGMIEAVGYKNYRKFFQIVNKCLKKDGLALIHTIGSNESHTAGDPWLEKYIFPNGLLPSLKQLTGATEKLFVLEDLHNFGADYDKTLMAWYENFERNWPELKADYDERFHRMWKYYLLSCAGILRARKAQLWQMVLSKDGVLGGYNSVR